MQRGTQRETLTKYLFGRVYPFQDFRITHCQKATDFFLKHHLKDSQPEKCRGKQSLRFSEGIFLQFLAQKKVAQHFRVSKKFAEKFFEVNIQLANSEMKISFPKSFGHFNFQLRNPNRSNFSSWLKQLSKQSLNITRSLEISLRGFFA